MTTDLLRSDWIDLDSAELRFILLELIGKPGQYDGLDSNPNTFYLPLAGSSCRIKLTFSDSKQIVAIEPGQTFDAGQWKQVVDDIERIGPSRLGATAASAASAWLVPGEEDAPAYRSCRRQRTRRELRLKWPSTRSSLSTR
ncbi:MAG: hypothetical protein EXR97_03890 [Nitrospiraceae bacterium]|nr:hypothetical protein [Nitrospiraceae bacterium]